MKKIILVFNTIVIFLFSFVGNVKIFNNEETNQVSLLSNNNECDFYDSIVNITTQNNLINVSGFIISSDALYLYIATSYKNYNKDYHYEIIFNDYTRRLATVVGYEKNDEILLLKVSITNSNYCSVNLSRSELIDKLERVNIIGKYNYNLAMSETHINAVGVCRNCNEETYKNYYYTLLSDDVDDYLIGAGVFDQSNQLIGIIVSRAENYNMGIRMLDVNKLNAICYNLIATGHYNKNYIKYNLLDVNSLTNYEKYLYSLNEDITEGVLVSSIHYLNYLTGGLNQGMVILSVNGYSIKNCYEFDNLLASYKDGTKVKLKVRTITNRYKVYTVKL